MALITHVPAYPLSQAVQLIWYWENYTPTHPKERILPFGMMELGINLRDEPMTLYYPEDGYKPRVVHGAFVAGARSHFFWVDTSRPTSMLSVWFKPGGALAFFGAAASAMLNQHIPLEALWARCEVDSLTDSLLSARTTSARFQCIEQVLLARLLQAPQRHRAVGYALRAFQTLTDAPNIAQIVDNIALSPTRFIDVFREEVGMTPKLYSRIQRFQRAARLIAQGAKHGLADIALAAGYYDQAHFAQEFRTFAGITLSAYQPQSPDHYSNLAVMDES